MTIQMIALDKLTASVANVRKTSTKDGIDILALNIDANGLLNNLVVIETDKGFEVVAGGRRFAALQLLAKQMKVAADVGIPCNVLPAGASATEISLAENELRRDMHPADQFAAFKKLADAGAGDDTIAARFGLTPGVVRQRLRLAVVSKKLMALFAKDDINLEQMMAFTLTDDTKLQEKVWADLPDHARQNGSPRPIRDALTEKHIDASDRLTQFVGLGAYEQAGGHVNRDLFSDNVYLIDPALLHRLAAEKLEAAAAPVRAEGWKWIEVAPEVSWEQRNKDGSLHPCYAEPSAEAQAAIATAQAEADKIMAEHGEEPEDAAAYDRLVALQDQIEQQSEAEEVWTETQKSVSGVYVVIGHDGEASIRRGVVKPEDKSAARRLNGAGEGRGAADDTPALEKPKAGISAALLVELTAHKTVAAQLTLAQEPQIGLLAVTHALAVSLLYPYGGSRNSALRISPQKTSYTLAVREAVDKSAPAKKLAGIVKGWQKKLPKESADLWAYLAKQKPQALEALLAVCAALTVDMVQEHGAPPRAASGELCKVLELDMATHWTATAASYFSRVPKKQVLAELNGTLTSEQTRQVEGMKRDQAAKTLEGVVKGKRWLPEALRS